jgi:alpha-1,6-mannosyltransferase
MLHRIACLLFVAGVGSTYLVAAAPPASRGAAYIAVHLVLSGLMLAAWATGEPDDHHWTLAAGVLARGVLVALPPFTTHDVDRYLWDGAVVLSGHDPYRLAPDDAALVSLRAEWPTPAEHARYPTLYPPGALALFALVAQVGPAWAPVVWKLLVLAASVATVFVAAALLRRNGCERHLSLVALSPLLVLEGGVGAHVDLIATLALAGALLLVGARRPAAAGATLGAGAVMKLAPALALVPLAIALGRRDAGRLLAAAGAVGALAYGGAVLFGLRPVGSLFVFLAQWRFGSPLYAAAEAVLARALVPLAATAALAAALLAAARAARRGNEMAGVQMALAAPLLASPVVFPWYLSALVPVLALRPSAAALLWLTAAPLTYEVIGRFEATGAWTPTAWPLWTTGAAWAIGLVLDGRARIDKRRMRDGRHTHDLCSLEPTVSLRCEPTS